jgi:hypothetical protein
MSVAPLVPVAADKPLPAGAAPARASDGSTAVSAIAATVAITAARPIDENNPFRANTNLLRGSSARQASVADL